MQADYISAGNLIVYWGLQALLIESGQKKQGSLPPISEIIRFHPIIPNRICNNIHNMGQYHGITGFLEY